MSHQSEKSNQHLLSNWKPENAQFWENKGNISHAETCGFPSRVCFWRFVYGCCLALLR